MTWHSLLDNDRLFPSKTWINFLLTSQLSIYGSEQKLWKYMLKMGKIQNLNKEPIYKSSTKKVIISQWLILKIL